MNILITGATGFIGRNLIYWLKNVHETDYKVSCLVRGDKFSTDFDRFLKIYRIKATRVKGDLKIPSSLSKAIAIARPDLVIHMAALTPVRNSWRYLKEYMEVNYFGTVNLIDAIHSSKKFRYAKLIYYSTMEVLKPYNSLDEFMRKAPTDPEDVPVYPSTPYAASKLAAEGYVKTQPYVDACIVRPCNTFDRSIMGINPESMGYFVEKAVTTLLMGRRPKFDGPPDRVRTWMHVSDHITALLKIMHGKWDHGKIFHIAPEDTTLSCGTMYHNILSVMENDYKIYDYQRNPLWGLKPRPYDPPVLAMKGGNVPSWKPEGLMMRLRETVDLWHSVLGDAKKV